MSNACPASTGRRTKAAENALFFGDDDPFDYELALALGEDLDYVETMPHERYIRWRAFFGWLETNQVHQAKVAAMRARR